MAVERRESLEDPPILIIGATGLVGSAVIRGLCDYGYTAVGKGSKDLDIRDKSRVMSTIRNFPGDTVILAGAYTNVDGAETPDGQRLAHDINVEGTLNVGKACELLDKKVIYISTAYTKADKLGNYAKSKLEGEIALNNLGVRHSIIYIDMPLGNWGHPKDLINKIIKLVENDANIFEDQEIRPTYMLDLVSAIKIIYSNELTGDFDVACIDTMTLLEFTQKLLDKMGRKDNIKIGSIYDFMTKPGVSPRPEKSNLDVESTQEQLGIKFHSVDEVLNEFISR